jgi:hypothetical protein
VEVVLYYQSTSKEYIEFLRDENTTSTLGQQLYDSWVAHGRAAPVVMAYDLVLLDLTNAPDPTDLPRVTRLAPNYPNPFNPTTTISYSLARDGHVKLHVYDATGRLVRTLVDSRMPVGDYDVTWDGRDAAGRALSSGVYLCRMETEDYRTTRKLMLVK